MTEAATARIKSRKKTAQNIPDYLVYKMVEDKPIYYKGYKDVLNQTKTFEEIIIESKLQAGLKAEKYTPSHR